MEYTKEFLDQSLKFFTQMAFDHETSEEEILAKFLQENRNTRVYKDAEGLNPRGPSKL